MNWSWSQCINSHHAQTSSGKGLPSHFWNRNIIRSILPGLRRKRTGLLLSGPKSSFQMKVNFAFNLEIKVPESGEAQNPCCLKSSVKFPQSVMIWAATSSDGVGPLCFLKSTVNAAIYQESLEHFILPSDDKLYGEVDFILQQDLAPAHTAKGTKSWFNDLVHSLFIGSFVLLCLIGQKTRLTWTQREYMGYCQEEDERHQTQQCRWPESHYQSNLGFHTTWTVPQADCLHATPHRCCNSCKRRPNQVLSA